MAQGMLQARLQRLGVPLVAALGLTLLVAAAPAADAQGRPHAAAHQLRAGGHDPHTTKHRPAATKHRPPTTKRRPPATKRKPPTPRLKISAISLPAAYRAGMGLTAAMLPGPTRVARVRRAYYVTVTVKGPHGQRHTKRVKRTRRVRTTVYATREWVVVSSALESQLLGVTPAGRVRTVATGMLPSPPAPAGQSSPLPAYGSVEADGFIWLINYQASPAVLYAVSHTGRIRTVAQLTGSLTGITAGPRGTLEITDNGGHIYRCRITKRPSANCVALPVPPTFSGGQVDAVGSAGGRVWFTDDKGELGSLNLSGNRFAGPFGDVTQVGQKVGFASAVPGTIVTSPRGTMFVAAGQSSTPLLQSGQIKAVNPRNGRVTRTYAAGFVNIVAMTVTADGRIWFLDLLNPATGAGRVGTLNPVTGAVREFRLPKGFRLPAFGQAIAPGPYGSDTAFFTLQPLIGRRTALGLVSNTQYAFVPAGRGRA